VRIYYQNNMKILLTRLRISVYVVQTIIKTNIYVTQTVEHGMLILRFRRMLLHNDLYYMYLNGKIIFLFFFFSGLCRKDGM